MALSVVNPATEETLETFTEVSPSEVSQIIEQSHEAFLNWRQVPFAAYATVMKQAAHVLREQTDNRAELMAQEMGKAIRDGRAEIEKCTWVCEYYAEQAESFLQLDVIETEARLSYATYGKC